MAHGHLVGMSAAAFIDPVNEHVSAVGPTGGLMGFFHSVGSAEATGCMLEGVFGALAAPAADALAGMPGPVAR
eukprot:14191352-Alexandrium_andersonii.AAC.1